MQKLITDPNFRVQIDLDGSSPNPEASIWRAQHVTHCEGFSLDDNVPASPGDAIIRHQLKPRHYSVLDFAFVVIHCGGFPHSTVMQLVRHQGKNSPLVQSGRYSGKRFIDVANASDSEGATEDVFYFRPVGNYVDREGHRYGYHHDDQERDILMCQKACDTYASRIKRGWAEEHARDIIPQNFRQNFVIAGTVRSTMHWLHQRTLADSQLEAQTLAWMALNELKHWSPSLFGYFEDNIAGRNTLAV